MTTEMPQEMVRRRRLVVLVPLTLVAALLSLLIWALRAPDADAVTFSSHDHHAMQVPRTVAQQAFHDQMRKLWEDHVTWTRLAIVSFADGSAGFPETANRLLRNQDDIGDAIKPFYGDAAGEQLSALLHDHITIAVEVMQAAKSGDTAAFNEANARWYANANDIADFLAKANPRFWRRDVMRADMKTHLDQTLTEAADELSGDYAGSVAEYDAVHAHILDMADMLSAGIIGQFPHRVR
jgi:hypothetical protein